VHNKFQTDKSLRLRESSSMLARKKRIRLSDSSVSLLARLSMVACNFVVMVSSASASDFVALLDLTFRNNPQLESQSRLIESSQADLRVSFWQFFPTASASVERVNAPAGDPIYTNPDGNVTVFRLQQPLWTAGRLTAGLNKSEAALLAAQAQFEETRQQLALRTIAAWGEWRAGEQKLSVLRESLQTHQRLTALIGRRVDEGLAASADLVLATGRAEQARVEIVLASAQQSSALARFEQLVGRRLDEQFLRNLSIKAVDPLPELPLALRQSWVISPTAIKIQAQIRQQELDVEIRKAQLFPEVYVRAEHQRGSYSAFGPETLNRLFLGLTATPGAGLSAKAGIDSATLRVRALQADLESNRRSLVEQVSLEHVAAIAQSQRTQGLRASATLTREMFDSWDRQFLAGRKTWVEVMNAARELAQVGTGLAEAEISHATATWRLKIFTDGIPSLLAQTTASKDSKSP
jgi:adhesin transport system outer membrane protein